MEQKPNIQQSKRKQELSKIPLNWVNQQTFAFFSNLSFQGYVLAGNSVANMVEKIPLQGDLDFWVREYDEFLNVVEQIGKHYEHFRIYPSYVEMYNQDGILPRINIIYTELSPRQTIDRFDFDYCRCYWTPGTGIVYGKNCLKSIRTKIITQQSPPYRITKKRILKAVKYGYVFTYQFWQNFWFLIKDPRLRIKQSEQMQPYPVALSDLDLQKFQMRQIDLKITDIKNVQQTLKQVAEQYRQLSLNPSNIKLPILVKIEKSSRQLLNTYIQKIVMINPLSDTHYMQIKIGQHLVYCEQTEQYNARRARRRRGSQEHHNLSLQSESNEDSSQNQNQKYNNQTNQQLNQKQQRLTLNIKQLSIKQPEIIQLNESGTAYITVSKLPKQLEKLGIETFHQMWNLKPHQKHKIIMFQQQYPVHRYSKSYLNTPIDLSHTKTRSYMYSGFDTSKNQQGLPLLFEPFYQFARFIDNRYNQVIVNWYQNELDFIAPHSDCQKGMILNAEIMIISFYPNRDETNFRYFVMTPKLNTKYLKQKAHVRLDHGSIVTMCGTTQKQFLHGINRQYHAVSPRISLSFRQMKEGSNSC